MDKKIRPHDRDVSSPRKFYEISETLRDFGDFNIRPMGPRAFEYSLPY